MNACENTTNLYFLFFFSSFFLQAEGIEESNAKSSLGSQNSVYTNKCQNIDVGEESVDDAGAEEGTAQWSTREPQRDSQEPKQEAENTSFKEEESKQEKSHGVLCLDHLGQVIAKALEQKTISSFLAP
jgi:hypothetical protein